MEHEEVVVDEHIPYEEQIEPFDWEDYLYESWLEEKRGVFEIQYGNIHGDSLFNSK
jgi:hypothetical protein